MFVVELVEFEEDVVELGGEAEGVETGVMGILVAEEEEVENEK